MAGGALIVVAIRPWDGIRFTPTKSEAMATAHQAPAPTAIMVPDCDDKIVHHLYTNPCSSQHNQQNPVVPGRNYKQFYCEAQETPPDHRWRNHHTPAHSVCLYCELAERASTHVQTNTQIIEGIPPALEKQNATNHLTRMCRKCEIREQLLQHRYLGTLGTVFPGAMPNELLMRNIRQSTCTCLSHLLGPVRPKKTRYCKTHLRNRWAVATPQYSGLKLNVQLARGARRPAAERAAKAIKHSYDRTPNGLPRSLAAAVTRSKIFLRSIALSGAGVRHVATIARRNAREYAAGPIPPPTALRRSPRNAAAQQRREQPKRMCRCGDITVVPGTEQVLQCMACHGFHFLILPVSPRLTAPLVPGATIAELNQNSLTHPQKFALDFVHVDATPI